MGFKDIMENIKARSNNRKEMIRDLDERGRIEDVVMNMRKSANQRELEGYLKERNEEEIKIQLDQMRKAKDHDIKFNHNPLDVPNITNKTEWSVLKEKNQFNNKKNMFVGNGMIHKNNPQLLKNAKWLMS